MPGIPRSAVLRPATVVTLLGCNDELFVFHTVVSVWREKEPPQVHKIVRESPHPFGVTKLQFHHVSPRPDPSAVLIFERFSCVQHAHIVEI